LTRNNKEEGRVWLLFLSSSLIGSLLLFLNPTIHTQSNSPFLWFSTSSLIFSIGTQWDKADWILQQCVALYLFMFLVRGYLNREKNPLPHKEISILFCGTFLGIFSLCMNKEFVLTSFLFCLDIGRLIKCFIEKEEIITSRQDAITLLLRFVSIILSIFFSSLVETGSTFLIQFFFMIVVIFLRITANYIDQVSQQGDFFGSLNNWFIFLDSLILVRMMSFMSGTSNGMTGLYLSLLLFFMILFLLLMMLLFRQRNLSRDSFIFIPVYFLIIIIFLLLGIRQELLFLLLPAFFLQINDQIELKKRGSILLQVVEIIFLIGLPFSSLYFVNKTLLDSQLSLLFIYSAFILEGIFLAGFEILQISKNNFYSSRKNTNMSLWIMLLGIVLILLKEFFVMDGLDQIAWLALSPAAGFILIPIKLLMDKRRKSEIIEQTNIPKTNSSLNLERITKVFLTISNIFRQMFEGISAVFEGEGGLVWAIIFLILLLTLFKGIS
ncbi:MAG: hypothetical protein GYA51_12020, partial [Candidatus Methanofastidiosa archaeon]|nr:hypothetical protein [Candidatus Methanofastidiosa archaeon]